MAAAKNVMPMQLPDREQQRKYMLHLIQQKDSEVVQILDMAYHVVLYTFDEGKEAWDRKGIEGTMCVVERFTKPYYQLHVLNNLGRDNLVETLDPDFHDRTELQDPFLLYRTLTEERLGMYFAAPHERTVIADAFRALDDKYRKEEEEVRLASEALLRKQQEAKRAEEEAIAEALRAEEEAKKAAETMTPAQRRTSLTPEAQRRASLTPGQRRASLSGGPRRASISPSLRPPTPTLLTSGTVCDRASVALQHCLGGGTRLSGVARPTFKPTFKYAGGFAKGDRVATLVWGISTIIDYTDGSESEGHVDEGDVGTVVDAVSPTELRVFFGRAKGLLDLEAEDLQPAKLAGWFYKSDRVRMVGDADGADEEQLRAQGVVPGELPESGVVEGPCSDETLHDKNERVLVSFGPGRPRINLHATSLLFFIPDGFRAGERVAILTDEEDADELDVGTVVGGCSDRTLVDKEGRLLVAFGGRKGKLNVLASNITRVFAGGYVVGDRINSLRQEQNVKHGLTIRSVGTVVGPCNLEDVSIANLTETIAAADEGSRVLVDFGGGHRLNLPVGAIKRVRLAGGYRKGSVVQLVSDYGPLPEGHQGTVLGPCADKALADGAERLMVNFPSDGEIERHRVNIKVHMLALVPDAVGMSC